MALEPYPFCWKQGEKSPSRLQDPFYFIQGNRHIADMFKDLIRYDNIKVTVREINYIVIDLPDVRSNIMIETGPPVLIIFTECIGSPDIHSPFQTQPDDLPLAATVVQYFRFPAGGRFYGLIKDIVIIWRITRHLNVIHPPDRPVFPRAYRSILLQGCGQSVGQVRSKPFRHRLQQRCLCHCRPYTARIHASERCR